MSELKEAIGRDLTAAGAKWVAGPGVTVFGVLTLNDVALIVGILSSLAILVTTCIGFFWKWQDRQKATRG